MNNIFKCICESKLGLENNGNKLICKSCNNIFNFDRSKNIYYITSPEKNNLIKRIDDEWTDHWKDTSSFFYKLKKFMRVYMTGSLLINALRPLLLNQVNNIYLEAGSGLSETSKRLEFNNNIHISMDISKKALENNINKKIKLQADLFNIPLLDEKVSVVFNVGVHEHYTDIENNLIFREYNRVLKENGKLILVWPYYFGPLMILAKIINFITSIILRRKFEIWPNQHNEIKNFSKVNKLLELSGFNKEKIYLSFYDIYSTGILIYKKK